MVRDVARDYIVGQLGDAGAVVALGELAVIKKGDASVGVASQFDAATRRVQNCQVGIFAAYVSRHGEALIDRCLYLPPGWADDEERRRRAGVPATHERTSKPELAAEIVRRTVAARVPFAWVTGGVELGRDPELRGRLAAHRLGYVVAVPGSQPLINATSDLVTADYLARNAWGSCREIRNESGGIWWASIPVGLPAGQPRPAPGFEHLLLVGGGDRKPRYYLAHAVEATPLIELIRTARSFTTLGACMRAARADAGLDNYEVRTWTAWHRHVTLALIAAFQPSAG